MQVGVAVDQTHNSIRLWMRCATHEQKQLPQRGACLPSVILTQLNPTHTLHSRSTTAAAECAQARHTPVL